MSPYMCTVCVCGLRVGETLRGAMPRLEKGGRIEGRGGEGKGGFKHTYTTTTTTRQYYALRVATEPPSGEWYAGDASGLKPRTLVCEECGKVFAHHSSLYYHQFHAHAFPTPLAFYERLRLLRTTGFY